MNVGFKPTRCLQHLVFIALYFASLLFTLRELGTQYPATRSPVNYLRITLALSGLGGGQNKMTRVRDKLVVKILCSISMS